MWLHYLTVYLGSLIVRPFLPAWEEESSVCNELDIPTFHNDSENAAKLHDDKIVSESSHITSISWPFLIIGSFNFLTAIAFLLLSKTIQ